MLVVLSVKIRERKMNCLMTIKIVLKNKKGEDNYKNSKVNESSSASNTKTNNIKQLLLIVAK